MENYKKVLLFLVLGIFIAPLTVFAQLQPYAPVSGVPQISSLPQLILNIINFIWIIFVAGAIILFVFAGFLFLTAQGDATKLTTARHAVLWGVVGVAVAVIAFSIIGLVENGIFFGT